MKNFVFFWLCLTPKWQHVPFLWIINEDFVNLKNKYHKWILRPKISHHANFQLFLTSLDSKWHYVTFLWIFNEDFVNFKNRYHKWIARPRISHHTYFHTFPALFDYFRSSMDVPWHYLTTCHFSWIFNGDIINIAILCMKWHNKTLINMCMQYQVNWSTTSHPFKQKHLLFYIKFYILDEF